MEKEHGFPSIKKQMQVHFEDRGSKLHVASKNAKLHCLHKQELHLKQMRGMLIHILKIKELLPTSINYFQNIKSNLTRFTSTRFVQNIKQSNLQVCKVEDDKGGLQRRR